MSNYTNLIADIPNWLDNESDELSDVISRLITLATHRLSRDLQDHNALDTSTAATLTVSTPTLASLPSDMKEARYLAITLGTGEQKFLEERLFEYIREYWPNSSSSGEPRYYALVNTSTAVLAPTPGSAYPYELGYRKRLAVLTSAASTNWLTDNAYDLLLAACCLEGAYYLASVNDDPKDASLIDKWRQRYGELLMDVRGERGRRRRDDYGVRIVKPENAE